MIYITCYNIILILRLIDQIRLINRLLVSVVAYTCPLTLVLRGNVGEICPRELKKTSQLISIIFCVVFFADT